MRPTSHRHSPLNRCVQMPLPSAHLPLVRDSVTRLQEMIAIIESGQMPETAHDLIAALGELEDEQNLPVAEAAPSLVGDAAAAVTVPAVEISAAKVQVEPFVEAAPAGPASFAAASPGLVDVGALIADIKPVAPVPVFEP